MKRYVLGVAVVKVTPSIGSVKYKAQPIVLAVRIPILTGCKWAESTKNGAFCCGFSRESAKFVGFRWGLLVSNRASFEGRRGGQEGQGAGGVQIVWIGVEMWERGMENPLGLQRFPG